MQTIELKDKRRGKLTVVASHVVAVYVTESGNTCVATTGGKFYVEDAVEEVTRLLREAYA